MSRSRHQLVNIATRKLFRYKAVTRFFFFGGGVLVPSTNFLLFHLSFPRLEVTEIQLKDFGSVVSSPKRGRTTFAATRHVPWALNTPKMHLRPSCGFRPQAQSPKNVSGDWKMSSYFCYMKYQSECAFFLNVPYVTSQSLIKFQVIIFTLNFERVGVLTPKTPR